MSRISVLESEIENLNEKITKLNEIITQANSVSNNVDSFINPFTNISSYLEKVQLNGRSYDDGAFQNSSNDLDSVKSDMHYLEVECMEKINQMKISIDKKRNEIKKIQQEEEAAKAAERASALNIPNNTRAPR